MYTLRVEAKDRKVSQLVLSDDKDPQEAFLDAVDPETMLIEFSAGNPRVEHITGVVHLYRTTPVGQAAAPAYAAVAAGSVAKQNNLPGERGDQLCCLAIPADMSVAEFCTFCGAYLEHIREMRVLRREASKKIVCMVLIRFKDQEHADSFYLDYNSKPFCILEPEILCRLVYVKQLEILDGPQKLAAAAAAAAAATVDAGAASGSNTPRYATSEVQPGQTELPTCPVCLERLDEHISGIVTTVCNHRFHSECLQRWGDTSCPVCRYCTNPSGTTSRCTMCGTGVDLWICIICGHIGCGRYREGHAVDHFRSSNHCYALELETQRVWDYVGDNYVHRLIQSKTDGKLVEVPSPAPPHQRLPDLRHGSQGHCCEHAADFDEPDEMKEAMIASKIDAIAAEYNHLLATQLDSQRQYFEGLLIQAAVDADQRCAAALASADRAESAAQAAAAAAKEADRKRQAAERKLAEASAQLSKACEEREFLRSLNDTLLANQHEFQARSEAHKAELEARDRSIKDLQEQVRDLMFNLEAQSLIEAQGATELKEGTILPVPVKPGGPSGSGRRSKLRSNK